MQRGLLLPWLREELRDQPLTHLLMDLMEDASLTPDERLLRLLVRMAPDLPPVWRGMSLAPADLAALAERAMQNDREARREIQTIYDREILTTLALVEASYSAAHRAWQEAVAAVDAAWRRAEQAGVPTALRPDLTTFLPSILLSGISESFRKQLRTSSRTIVPEAGAIPWFAALGDVKTLPMAVLPLLLALAPSAEEEVIWNHACHIDTTEGYEDYLQHYPNGRFVKDASEKPFWRKTCQANNLASYDEYLQRYPQGNFAEKSHQRLSKLLRSALLNDLYNNALRRQYLNKRRPEQEKLDIDRSKKIAVLSAVIPAVISLGVIGTIGLVISPFFYFFLLILSVIIGASPPPFKESSTALIVIGLALYITILWLIIWDEIEKTTILAKEYGLLPLRFYIDLIVHKFRDKEEARRKFLGE
ncbi:membrane hypothetical protein [Gammaproteobacteria bacterium]